jgi:hypothetical protein
MQTDRPEEFVLGRLHPEKERREVNDPRGIGVAKLDASARFERGTLTSRGFSTGRFAVTGGFAFHARSPSSSRVDCVSIRV